MTKVYDQREDFYAAQQSPGVTWNPDGPFAPLPKLQLPEPPPAPEGRIAGDWWFAQVNGRYQLYNGSKFEGWLDTLDEVHAHVAEEVEREIYRAKHCDCGAPASTISGMVIDGLCHGCRGERWAEEHAESRRGWS